MKTVYIPKGETVHYESLVTERLIVKGCLRVTYGVKAKSVVGGGVICAESVQADEICLSELEAATVICKRLIAKRVQAPELFASESAAVSCFLSAAYVETGKLTVAVSEIDQLKANEVVNLPVKKRTLFGTLLRSTLRSVWTAWTTFGARHKVVDADYTVDRPEGPAAKTPDESARAQAQPETDTTVEPPPKGGAAPVDEELNRIINIFKLLRTSVYTLKIIPGTPEENAPVFNFGNKHTTRPAA
jgi:hypothetical protein